MEDDGGKECPEVNKGDDGEREKKDSGGGNVAGPSRRMKESIASGYKDDSLVYWESLLDGRSLRVLLVENDASVLLAITLLLRKCGYQVATNGLQAWKILEDLSNHFDLVLIEVDIPCLSGIELLSNIMSHHIRNKIPVVMMSFRDSMSLVFKCLSEGAVDYLLKPVRKNELQNLWLHIWRRWQSYYGIQSENGAQAQNPMKLKGIEESHDNNTGSNNEDDSASFDLIAEGGSDNASDTQSSWTKAVLEVNSSQPVSPLDQMAGHPDSTRTLVMCSKSKVFGQEEVLTTVGRPCQTDEKEFDNSEFPASNRYLISESKEPVGVTKEETRFHLRIKRLREATVQDNLNALSHLGIPVLSRYRTASNANKLPRMNNESSSRQDDYISVLRGDSATSRDNCPHPRPTFTSLGNNLLFSHPLVILDKPDHMPVKENKPQPSGPHQEFLVQNFDHYHHHGRHPVRSILQKLPPRHENLSLKKRIGAAPQSGSSNTFGMEGLPPK